MAPSGFSAPYALAARCGSFRRQARIKGSCNLRKLLLFSYCAAGNASAAVVCAAQCRHACIKGSCNLVSTAPATRTITRLSQVCADGSPLLTRQVLVSCCGGCGAPVCGGCGAPVVVVVVGFKGDLPISHNVGLRPWPVFVSPRSFLRTNCESYARGPQAARVR